MYAIIETGGKQYQVRPRQTVKVELLEAEPGQEVKLGRVLALCHDDVLTVGKPEVAGAEVVGRVLGEALGKKLIVYKFKRRKKYRRNRGHRQHYTSVEIKKIMLNGEALQEAVEEVEEVEKTVLDADATPEPETETAAEAEHDEQEVGEEVTEEEISENEEEKQENTE